MPYTIDWKGRRVCVRYSGLCTSDDIFLAVVQLQAHPNFDTTPQALHDFSECEGMSFSIDRLEEIAIRNIGASRSNTRLQIAVVSDRPDVHEMLRCFGELKVSPYPMQTFKDVDSADAWLTGRDTVT